MEQKSVNLNLLVFVVEDLYKSLNSVKINKGAGPDAIAPVVLRKCASQLCVPLCYLFNESLRIGYCPVFFKIASITPIFKKGARDEIENYRGVAKQSSIPKLLDQMVNEQLKLHVKDVISSSQHGFMKGKSCATNLVEYTSFLSNQLEQPNVKQIDVIFTDFSKAFDRVNIGSVIGSLESYGICGSLLKWFESFLSNRLQYVSLKKSIKSENFEVVSGVLQRSHCVQTLFNLVLNQSSSLFGTLKDSFYADDAKLCLPIENQNCCNYLQDKTTGFINWCSQIGLDINVDKCKVMSFSKSRNVINFDYKVDGRTIERVNKISDLGVIFNSKLNFNDDCTFRVSKAKSMLGFVKRQVSELQDPDILKSLYCSLVRSNV